MASKRLNVRYWGLKLKDGICFDIHMNVEGLAPDWTIPEAVRKVTGYKENLFKMSSNHRKINATDRNGWWYFFIRIFRRQ